MKREYCPIAARCSDFCCEIALYDKETYEDCICCANYVKKQLDNFIKWLKTTK